MFLLVMLLGFMKLPTTWAAIEADGAPHPDGTSVSSHHSAQKRLIDAELKQRHGPSCSSGHHHIKILNNKQIMPSANPSPRLPSWPTPSSLRSTV